jgi:hypothetical protein
MYDNTSERREYDPARNNPNDPFVPDRNRNSYLGMGLGLALVIAIIVGSLFWTPSSQRSANMEPPANSTIKAPQLPSPDPSAAPTARPNG